MDLEQKVQTTREFLSEVFDDDPHVYYSPPTGMEMLYPCIVFNLAGGSAKYADNIPYFIDLEWAVTVIDEEPDSKIVSKMMQKPKCKFDRPIVMDGLNHFYFTLYF